MELRKLAGQSLQRDLRLERGQVDEQARTVVVAFASELPYQRSWGVEILSMDPSAVRLGRLTSGGAVLVNHDADDQVGVVEAVSLDGDRTARAVLRFGRSQRAQEVFQDVLDGVRRLVSVGYLVHQVKAEDSKATPPVYRVTDWEPFEVSIVAVPADPTVGVGRSADQAVAADAPTVDTNPIIEEAIPMSDSTASPAAVAPAAPVDASAIRAGEAARINEIFALARAHGQIDLAQQFLDRPVEEFKSALLDLKRSAPVASAADLGMSKQDVQQYSLLRAIRGVVDGNFEKAAPLEAEAHRALAARFGERPKAFYVPMEVQRRDNAQRRDLSSGVAAQGGFLVETTNMSFIEILRNRSIVQAAGATRMSGLVGNVTVPRQTGAATASWLATEATAVTESDQVFAQMTLSPKNVAAYTEISRQLTLQSDPSAEMIVMNDLAAQVALAVDLAAVNGTAASGQPRGILNTAGIGSVTGTSLAYAGILEFQTDVIAANGLVNPATAAYVTTPAVAALLAARQRFTSTDSPLWQGNLLNGTVSGYNAYACTNMPAATAIFGDWSQLVIGEWGQLAVEVNPYANFPAGIVGVRAFYTCDIGVRYAASFSAATSIT
jgi:HK97 family phage major capsid protein